MPNRHQHPKTKLSLPGSFTLVPAIIQLSSRVFSSKGTGGNRVSKKISVTVISYGPPGKSRSIVKKLTGRNV